MKLAPDLRAMLDATESSKHPITGLPNCSEEEIEQRNMIFLAHDQRRWMMRLCIGLDQSTWPTAAPETWAGFTRVIGWSNSRIANHFAEEMAAIRRQEQEKKDAKRN